MCYTPFTRWSWLDEQCLRLVDMAWWAWCVLDVCSTSARRALVEPARRASSSSQLHRVNGVLDCRRPLTWQPYKQQTQHNLMILYSKSFVYKRLICRRPKQIHCKNLPLDGKCKDNGKCLDLLVYYYTVSQKKQDTWFFIITLANVNRFSKFFHNHNRKKIL